MVTKLEIRRWRRARCPQLTGELLEMHAGHEGWRDSTMLAILDQSLRATGQRPYSRERTYKSIYKASRLTLQFAERKRLVLMVQIREKRREVL